MESKNWRFVAGNSFRYKFGVTREGYLAAARGIIGGWTIEDNGLYTAGGGLRSDNMLVASLVTNDQAYLRLYIGGQDPRKSVSMPFVTNTWTTTPSVSSSTGTKILQSKTFELNTDFNANLLSFLLTVYL